MPGKFPTALHMLEDIKVSIGKGFGGTAMRATAIERDAFHGLEARRFDVTLPDGRIYRVRVSDISPPAAERVKEITS